MKPVKKGRTFGPATQMWGRQQPDGEDTTADREGRAPMEHTGSRNMGIPARLTRSAVVLQTHEHEIAAQFLAGVNFSSLRSAKSTSLVPSGIRSPDPTA